LKRELANFVIGVSDVPKYDIIWTENGDVTDSFIPEILTFKAINQVFSFQSK